MSEAATATVELLIAEVRVLMVGARQVTLSVFRQLDLVGAECIEPFGRVRESREPALRNSAVQVVGADVNNGPCCQDHDTTRRRKRAEQRDVLEHFREVLAELPLLGDEPGAMEELAREVREWAPLRAAATRRLLEG